jgi:hypothetical protein
MQGNLVTFQNPKTATVIDGSMLSSSDGRRLDPKPQEITPSREQERIFTSFQKGNNIICDAVAGGAKSTTLMLLIQRNPSLSFFGLSYNRALVESANRKLSGVGGARVSKFQTYHTAMQTCYDIPEVISDDFLFEKWLVQIESGSVLPLPSGEDYNCLLVDETQDMRYPYFRLIVCLLRQVFQKSIQIVAVGASDQVLYDFFEIYPADKRFLLQLPKLLTGYTHRKWDVLRLSQSFRLTPAVANFANYLQGTGSIQGVNTPNYPVQYWICDPFSMPILAKIHKDVLVPYRHQRVVLLFPSVNTRLCRYVVNGLSQQYGAKFNVQNHSPDSHKERALQVSSYHAFKGLEAEAVVLFGLHSPKYQTDSLLDSMNVAITRTRGRLFVLHHFKNPYAPFFKNALVNCDLRIFRGHPYNPSPVPVSPAKKTFIQVEGLCRFSEPRQVSELLGLVERKESPISIDGPVLSIDEVTVHHKAVLLLKLERLTWGNWPSVRKLLQTKLALSPLCLSEVRRLNLAGKPNKQSYQRLGILLSSIGGFCLGINQSDIPGFSGFDPPVEYLQSLGISVFSDQSKYKRENITYSSKVDGVLENGTPVMFSFRSDDPLAQLSVAVHAAVRNKPSGWLVQLDTNTVVVLSPPVGFLNRTMEILQTNSGAKLTDELFEKKCTSAFPGDI